MDRSDVIELVAESTQRDAKGVMQKTETARRVFCSVASISRAEFFDAGRNGLNPEFRFKVFAGDYNGERTLRYKGQAYGIYRTYLASTDTMELYAERKGGTNGSTEGNGG